MIFPTDKFGYSQAEGYSYATDLALLTSAQSSGYTRQRRTYLHNASKFSLSFNLTASQASDLRTWLQENNDWFTIPLLSGNDASATCQVYETNVRRTSSIEATRAGASDLFTVRFEVETHSMPGYQALALEAANQPVQNYPADLPLPMASGFTSSHGDRNVTTYSMTFQMGTKTLKSWQQFAGYKGTAWFKMLMVSPNAFCSEEVLRFIDEPSMTLIRPDYWEVTVTAQTMPLKLVNLEDTLIPIGECAYNSAIDYDYPLEEYDCAGQVGPPTGDFVMPVGPFNINVTATGYAPQTTEAWIKFGKDGSVTSSPVGSPAWTEWHTDPYALPAAAIAFDAELEMSNNGTTWNTYTPSATATPKFINLQTNDVYVRRKITTNVDVNQALTFTVTFESDKQTDQYTTAGATVTINSAIDIITRPNTIILNFAIEDTFYGMADPDGSNPPWKVGAIIKSDGTSISVNGGGNDGNWASPISDGTGIGKWIIATKTSGADVLSNAGIRIPMDTDVTYQLPDNTINELDWSGTLQIYDAAAGGTLLGSGTLVLYGFMEPREPDLPPGTLPP